MTFLLSRSLEIRRDNNESRRSISSSLGASSGPDWADCTQPEVLSDISYVMKDKDAEVPMIRLVNSKTGSIVPMKVNIFEREYFISQFSFFQGLLISVNKYYLVPDEDAVKGEFELQVMGQTVLSGVGCGHFAFFCTPDFDDSFSVSGSGVQASSPVNRNSVSGQSFFCAPFMFKSCDFVFIKNFSSGPDPIDSLEDQKPDFDLSFE